MGDGAAGLKSGFMPELNGLRAIAIVLVVLHHLDLLEVGWIGVDLFFVLSGFLITGILLDTKQATNYFRGFYARRVLRIFPLYYVVLTGVLLLGALARNPNVSAVLPVASDRWLFYSYLSNWFALWHGYWQEGFTNYLGHFWSLAVEEQFYLAWPLIVWLLPARKVPWAAGALAVLSALSRVFWMSHGGDQLAIACATTSRMDALFLGAICASIFRSENGLRRVRLFLPIVAFVCIGMFAVVYEAAKSRPQLVATVISSPWAARFTPGLLFAELGGYTLLAVGFAALVLASVTFQYLPFPLLRLRWLGKIGKYSYGIYVFHVPVLGATKLFLIPFLIGTGMAPTAITALALLLMPLVTYAIAAISYECFEKRFLAHKRSFEPRYASSSPRPLAVSV